MDGIYIQPIELLLLVLIILFIAFYIKLKKAKLFQFILALSCILFIVRIYDKTAQWNSNLILIYAIPGTNIIDLIQNNNHIVFLDATSFNHPQKIDFACNNYW